MQFPPFRPFPPFLLSWQGYAVEPLAFPSVLLMSSEPDCIVCLSFFLGYRQNLAGRTPTCAVRTVQFGKTHQVDLPPP